MRQTLQQLFLAFAFFTLIACSDDDDNTDPPAEANATVRVIHTSVDAPAVDIEVDGATVVTNLDYAAASSILSLEEGGYDVNVNAFLPDSSTVTVISVSDLQLSADTIHNVIAVGTVDSAESAELEAIVVTDNQELTDSSMVRLNVGHLSPAVGAVDIYLTTPVLDLTSTEPSLSGVVYKQFSGGFEVSPGNYQVRITGSGSKDVVFDSGSLTFTAGQNLLVGAIPNAANGDSPVQLMVVEGGGALTVSDVNTGADLRAVHASAAAGAVDVYLNDAATDITSFTLGSVAPSTTTYLTSLPAGDANVKVIAAGNTDLSQSAINVTLPLSAAVSYTAIAVGNGVDKDLKLLALTDQRRSIATQASVRLVHAATLAEEVDIYLLQQGAAIGNTEPALQDVPYEAETGFLALSPGDYDLLVTPANTATEALRASISLTGGGIYTGIVRDNDSQDGVTAILLDSFVSD